MFTRYRVEVFLNGHWETFHCKGFFVNENYIHIIIDDGLDYTYDINRVKKFVVYVL